jgi:fructuronate reductase
VSAHRLSRAAGQGRSAAPVRLLHLGLGNFFRAHQCWYTEHAPDAGQWGIAGFTGRGSQSLVDQLTEQQGLYTLVTRARDADQLEVLSGLSGVHVAADNDAWVRYFESPDLAAVTITVTEAGYLRGGDGGLDTGRPEVQADIQVLRADPTGIVRTAPARLVAGLAARRRAGAGPIALVPCDNVPGNGALAERVVRDLAQLVDDKLAAWLTDSVAVVTTMVDRITPAATPEDVRAVYAATGFEDRCPIVTEPFHEWVLSGTFPAGKPRWEDAGATFTQDITPYEHRKLWLLNGAHSLLAYAGSIRGHDTVPAAIADETCRSWVEEWWAVASAHLDQPAVDIAAYRAALLQRFSNPRMRDRLYRIAADGSQKLPIRLLPVLRAERAAGRVPAAATRVLAAWISHLRGAGPPVSDVRADVLVPLAAGELAAAVPRVLGWLDPALAADPDVVSTVVEQSEEFSRTAAVARGSAAQR